MPFGVLTKTIHTLHIIEMRQKQFMLSSADTDLRRYTTDIVLFQCSHGSNIVVTHPTLGRYTHKNYNP